MRNGELNNELSAYHIFPLSVKAIESSIDSKRVSWGTQWVGVNFPNAVILPSKCSNKIPIPRGSW